MKDWKFTIPTVIIGSIISVLVFLGLISAIVFQPERITPTTINKGTDLTAKTQTLTDTSIVTLRFDNNEISAEVAASSLKQEKGLMGRTSLPENGGMLFVFPESIPRTFWMKDTLISLDIIYFDETLKVVNLHKATKVNQTVEIYPSILPAKYVLEMAGGWSELNGLQIGDSLTIE
jgi:uncharacterized membrane protein (UPF0127 family)